MIVLPPDRFVPEAWRAIAATGPVRMFNPGLTTFGGRRIMAYRLVLADGRRRLAICALEAAAGPVPGSVQPLSDHLAEAGPWLADPRFCILGDRLLLHFNTGDRPRPNTIFLVEIDPQSLLPRAAEQPLELEGRRPVEKNWMLFSPDGHTLLAVYSIRPHVVLRLHLGAGASVPCEMVSRHDWTAPVSRSSEPRGGTPPIRVGDIYYSFFHHLVPAPRWKRVLHGLRHRGGRPLHRYEMGFYGFRASPPFAPVCHTPVSIAGAPARRAGDAPRLNRDAERVLYPMGAAFSENRWTVAAGLHDDRCCLLHFDHADLLRRVEPVA